MSTEATPDFAAITSRQKAVWSEGDFHTLAITVMPVAENLIYTLDPRPGQRVLDIACGSGNCSIVAARRFCDVTGLDFAPNLLERARRRAEADGLHAEFIAGDSQALPFTDESFDVVVSTWGIMFAPDQERAAQEMLRVARPGARIGLVNWTPEHFGGLLFRTIAKYVPPPPGLKPGTRWGTEQGLRELIGHGVTGLNFELRTMHMIYPGMEFLLDTMFRSFGPIAKFRQTADESTLLALRRDLRDTLTALNRATDGSVSLEATFAQATARRR